MHKRVNIKYFIRIEQTDKGEEGENISGFQNDDRFSVKGR